MLLPRIAVLASADGIILQSISWLARILR